jgi:type VI protein secretion system component Hcp
MRILIFLLLLFPFFGNAQKTEIFIRLTDAKGQQIKGESVSKGFENWLGTTSLTAGGQNNTQLSFTMTVNGASADLKRALANREFLLNGQVSAMVSDPSRGVPMKSYTIKMEKIAVLTCYETMGCNNVMNTTVTLQVARIGWTYYNAANTGAQTVSRKFGWDSENNTEWTSF